MELEKPEHTTDSKALKSNTAQGATTAESNTQQCEKPEGTIHSVVLKPNISSHSIPSSADETIIGGSSTMELEKPKDKMGSKALKPNISLHSIPSSADETIIGGSSTMELENPKDKMDSKALKPNISSHSIPSSADETIIGWSTTTLEGSSIMELEKPKDKMGSKALKSNSSSLGIPPLAGGTTTGRSRSMDLDSPKGTTNSKALKSKTTSRATVSRAQGTTAAVNKQKQCEKPKHTTNSKAFKPNITSMTSVSREQGKTAAVRNTKGQKPKGNTKSKSLISNISLSTSPTEDADAVSSNSAVSNNITCIRSNSASSMIHEKTPRRGILSKSLSPVSRTFEGKVKDDNNLTASEIKKHKTTRSVSFVIETETNAMEEQQLLKSDSSQSHPTAGKLTQRTAIMARGGMVDANRQAQARKSAKHNPEASGTKDSLASQISNPRRIGIQRENTIASFRRTTNGAQSEIPTGILRNNHNTILGNELNDEMDKWEKKLMAVQTEFLKNEEDAEPLQSDTTEKLTKQFRFMTVTHNGARKILVKNDQLKKIPPELPVTSVGDFKEQIATSVAEHLTSLSEYVKCNSIKSGERDGKLKEIKTTYVQNIHKLLDGLCANYNDSGSEHLTQLLKDLEETQAACTAAETTLTQLKQDQAEKIATFESLTEEFIQRETVIAENQKKLELLERENNSIMEELNICKTDHVTLQASLSTSEEAFDHERKELNSLNGMIKQLEAESLELHQKCDASQAAVESDSKISEYFEELGELRNTVNGLEDEKLQLMQTLNDINDQVIFCSDLRQKLSSAIKFIDQLKETLIENDRLVNAERESCKKSLLELDKMHESEVENTSEIKCLKIEISKTVNSVEQLKTQTERDRQLLVERSDIIHSLQTSETNHCKQIHDLVEQVSEKNKSVHDLNVHLLNKSDENRQMYAAINYKHLEYSSQSEMIKLLEESNTRSQRLCAEQEEKISRMKEIINHLKQTIYIYQSNILSGNDSNADEVNNATNADNADKADNTNNVDKANNSDNVDKADSSDNVDKAENTNNVDKAENPNNGGKADNLDNAKNCVSAQQASEEHHSENDEFAERGLVYLQERRRKRNVKIRVRTYEA